MESRGKEAMKTKKKHTKITFSFSGKEMQPKLTKNKQRVDRILK